ncbi:MAG: precorrin-6A/cobalt-precorrin-6A reductase [Methylococcales bacterium]|nr:precorrin-6A/cobalt-precorrin-6A reductase [Methylococcales bacterium]
MSILLLGGTADAKQLANKLTQQNLNITYSQQGSVRTPTLPCPVISGGFSQYAHDGINGLEHYCKQHKISQIIDATHPYAEQMSKHANLVATRLAIKLVQLYRSPWQATEQDNWTTFESLSTLPEHIKQYQRPFFTVGQSVSQLTQYKTNAQTWLVRQIAPEDTQQARVEVIHAMGPFSVTDEIQLMRSHKIDVLISKNSGGQMSFAKIEAARALNLPVFMLKRPNFKQTHHCFNRIQDCVNACTSTT